MCPDRHRLWPSTVRGRRRPPDRVDAGVSETALFDAVYCTQPFSELRREALHAAIQPACKAC